MTTALLDLARSIALEAGELAARRRREGVEVAATKSTIVDVVPAAAREVERLIRGRLADARPDARVTGVEFPVDERVEKRLGLIAGHGHV